MTDRSSSANRNARGVEQVDFGSGNLLINIPVLSVPGRGMGFNFSLRYNALFWAYVNRANPSGGTLEFWNIEKRGYLTSDGLGWETSLPALKRL